MKNNMNSIVRQAQKMQNQISKIQDEFGSKKVEASTGGGMVTAVLGPADPADVEPMTAISTRLNEARTPNQLSQFGIAPASARVYADATADPSSWVEITAAERHSGGTSTHADVAAGVLDSPLGRIVSIPRKVNGELYGSFLAGTQDNLQRALDGLVSFLPAGSWFEAKADLIHHDDGD